MDKKKKKKKFLGFNADDDVTEYIKRQNDIVYRTIGRTNTSAAINMLIRKGAEANGWKK